MFSIDIWFATEFILGALLILIYLTLLAKIGTKYALITVIATLLLLCNIFNLLNSAAYREVYKYTTDPDNYQRNI